MLLRKVFYGHDPDSKIRRVVGRRFRVSIFNGAIYFPRVWGDRDRGPANSRGEDEGALSASEEAVSIS